MPYKKGPNNTLRYYSSTTGKYIKDPGQLEFSNSKKQKMTFKEKAELKRQNLYNHAAKSKDKYVYEIFSLLEKNEPGNVILVNDVLYHKKINSTREIDIMTKSSIIEVKSGKVRHKTRQFLEQKDLAREHNKEHIVYAPDITEKKYLELKSKGINVIRNKEELLGRNKKWKT